MKRTAVYAGSFDPPTLGHLDIIRKVLPLFDKAYLVVAENHSKKTLFDSTERCALLKDAVATLDLPTTQVEICAHSGLIVDFCREKGAKVLIRGLRALSDFENEFQIASMNRRLNSEVETLHIMADEKFFFISSSLIKEVAYHGADMRELVPKNVAEALQRKLKPSKSKESRA